MKNETGNGTVSRLERAWVTTASAAVVALRWPLAAVTGREPDGWRRALGLGLRSDGTKFGLSAFGLDLFSDLPEQERTSPTRKSAEAHFAKRWAAFVSGESEAGWVLRHRRHHVERLPGRADVVVARFSTNGEMERIEPVAQQPEEPVLDDHDVGIIAESFCAAHRATREMPERERPQALLRAAEAAVAQAGAGSPKAANLWDAQRISAACQVSFETIPESTGRFLPPDFRFRRPPGRGVLNVVARLSADFRSVDVWLQIHHVATDGAPIQEMLVRLEKAWGLLQPLHFPKHDPARGLRVVSVQPSLKDRPVCEVVDFINFAPLLSWRETMNTRYRERIGGSAPIVCALLWQLARQPEFAGRKFATAVDVPPNARHPRAVAMLGIRPADYASDPEGFADFARDYLQLLEKARARTTAGWLMLRQLALLPTWLAQKALKATTSRGRQVFGTVGVSMLKDARVFSATMEDVGWYDGFLAIGSVSLPAGGEGTVAAITARGEDKTIRQYPGAIRLAIQACTQVI
jgi:hypothetical protein